MTPVSEGTSPTNYWDQFETAQQEATDALDSAREQYQNVRNVVPGFPDELSTALNQSAEKLDQIDDVLDVTESDAQDAVELAQRVKLLEEFLDAMSAFHLQLLRTEFSMYEDWFANMKELADNSPERLEETQSTLRTALNTEAYSQLRGEGPFTLSAFRADLYELDSKNRSESDPRDYTVNCLETADELVDQSLDSVKEMINNGIQVTIKSARTAVEAQLDQAREALEDESVDEDAVQAVRAGLEGALILRYQVAYERQSNKYCNSLEAILEEHTDSSHSASTGAKQRNVKKLEELAVAAVADETTVSTEEQVVNILRENDHRVSTALQATKLETTEFFDALRTAFENGDVSEIEVRFE